MSMINKAMILFGIFSVLSLSESQTNLKKGNKYQFYQNEEILTSLSLGTPAQSFNLQIDSASSYTWVLAKKCEKCENLDVYNSSASSTSKTLNEQIDIETANGEFSGELVKDTAKFSGKDIQNFTFVAVNKTESSSNRFSSGQLGLAYKNTKNPNLLFLNVLKNNNFINRRVFSLQYKSNKNKAVSSLDLGNYPSNFNSKSFSSCNISNTDDLDEEYSQGWICDLSHILIGNSMDYDKAEDVNSKILFNTGNGYIIAPKGYLPYFQHQYLKNCSGVEENDLKFLICPKALIATYKPLHFIVEGWSYSIPEKDLFVEYDSKNMKFLIAFGDEELKVWNFGLAFLKNFVTVFDMDEKKISFGGGIRHNFVKDFHKEQRNEIANQKFYLILSLVIIGVLLLLIILFLAIRAARRASLSEESKPFAEEEENK